MSGESAPTPGFFAAEADALLRDWERGSPEARDRMRALLGERERLTRPAALYAVAVDHGFTSWTSFRRRPETAYPVLPVWASHRLGPEG